MEMTNQRERDTEEITIQKKERQRDTEEFRFTTCG